MNMYIIVNTEIWKNKLGVIYKFKLGVLIILFHIN
jgi:hypothetical protein